MNDTKPPIMSPDGTADEPSVATTSVGAKLTNIFVQPGDVFDEVRQSPHNFLNWLVPTLISVVVGLVFVWVVFSQDTIMQQMRDAQAKEIEAKVTAGKMSQQQADQAIQVTQRFMTPLVIKALGSVFTLLGCFAWLFGLSLLFWLIGRFVLKADFGYLKAVEVTGLAAMITVLGTVLTMLIVVAMGNLAMNPGPVLLVRDFDSANKLHRVLSALSLPMLWHLAVMGTGLSRLSGRSWLAGAACVFIPYAVIQAGLILLGMGGGGF